MHKKPEILKSRLVAKSQLFKIEQIDLSFANGEQRCFERISGNRPGAVMMIPLLDKDTVLLVREYAVGTDRYELGLPKGLLEDNENLLEAANRELQEEIGYAAKTLKILKTMTTAPGYLKSSMHLVLATDLYPSKIKGDEPEEIEVVPWQLSNINALLELDEFSEARSIAAMYLVRDLMR